MKDRFFTSLAAEIDRIPSHQVVGRVTAVHGLLVECAGLQGMLGIGGRCAVPTVADRRVTCEVVGFRDDRALLMPFDGLEGVSLGSPAFLLNSEPVLHPGMGWLGRVVNAFGEPVDGKGPIADGPSGYLLRGRPPPAHRRQRVQGKVDLGVRALNTFITCCRGQRMGIFAASGVGKSVLLSMMARYTSLDVTVIGLIGERGREVQEFLQDFLGPEGLARSVVIVATSDESALMRRQAAYLTMSVAEFFRDEGNDVLCLMDSVTRFAMAQREIGLASGEPPASKGYTPSVFAELPKLLERGGPGTDAGSITGLFTVLVEGDDHNEPVSDAVRGILDGHVVMERSIAERGRYPAINVLRSISRTMPQCNTEEQNVLVNRARQLMATYADMEEMIRLGAYRRGSDPAVDESILYHEALETYLSQAIGQTSTLDDGYAELEQVLAMHNA